ncbi:MAG TPA: histidine kinase dimerization/phosphoacceptor domain-containing protein, partial [Acidimicrobiales bacterium]|nr:histidine kinase dimerization/phosphoacceptor domain-containing protein [Acidimicrobiales bacterium]
MAGLARRDVLLGSVALVTEVAEIALHGPGSWALALIGAVAVTAALLVGRRAPLAGGVAFAAGYAALAAGGMSNQATAAVMWVLVSYRVALAADTSVEVGVGALVSVVPIVMFGLANRDQSVDEFAPVDLLLMGGVWVAGRAMRQRQLRLADLEERVKLSEREREALARVAVAEERTRIARELHDVVAHGLSLIVVQAQAANSLLDRAPDRARTAVIAIEDAGRDALVDMRRLLGVLRGEDAPSGLAPQPSLARLDA